MLEALKDAHAAAVAGRRRGHLAGRAAAATGRLSKPHESLVLNLTAMAREFHDRIFGSTISRARVESGSEGARETGGGGGPVRGHRRQEPRLAGIGGSSGDEKLMDLGNGLTWLGGLADGLEGRT